MHNFNQSYNLILKEFKKISEKENFYFKPIKPKVSDLELIALSVLAEFKSVDSEHQLFRELKGTCLEGKIERSVYNKRRRKLFLYTEQLRLKMVKKLNLFEEYFIVDSMPLEICKLSRHLRSKICKELNYAQPDTGYCASQKMYYYGYKLHAVCSIKGVIQSYDLTSASVHDIHYLKDIKQQLSDCVVLGDKGYLSSEIQLDLFNSTNIKLETPKRINQKDFKPQFYLFRKKRKRIETLFSQLCDQFMIRRNYAKTFHGFKTRIITKISALTMVQYLNKFIFNRNMNNIKTNLV